jgi:hypothetical protein
MEFFFFSSKITNLFSTLAISSKRELFFRPKTTGPPGGGGACPGDIRGDIRSRGGTARGCWCCCCFPDWKGTARCFGRERIRQGYCRLKTHNLVTMLENPFSSLSLTDGLNKLECLSLECFFHAILTFKFKLTT